MRIEHIPELALTAGDDAQIAALLAVSFGQDFGGRSFYKQRHHLRLVMRVGGRVVGHVALCFRDIRMGDAAVTMVGVAEVATDPAMRGQGIAGALLREAVSAARRTLADFMVLSGDRPLYAGHGFARQANPLRHVVMDQNATFAVRTLVDDNLMVLALGIKTWQPDALIDLKGPLF